MDEERQRRILEDLIDQRLHAERKVILDVLKGVIVNEHQRVGGDLCEEIRQWRLELGQLSGMIDDLRRDFRQVQQAGSEARAELTREWVEGQVIYRLRALTTAPAPTGSGLYSRSDTR
jgi:hypothetical protein